MTDEQGFADRMNSLPKYVALTTLTDATWNASILGDVPTEIAALKHQSGANILVYGSSQLVQTLIQHDLVDEYRLLVYPVVWGSGVRLFKADQATLKFVACQSFSSGVVALTYEPDRTQQADAPADGQP